MNIPYGQFQKIKRNYTDINIYKEQANILKKRFKENGYLNTLIEVAYSKALDGPKTESANKRMVSVNHASMQATLKTHDIDIHEAGSLHQAYLKVLDFSIRGVHLHNKRCSVRVSQHPEEDRRVILIRTSGLLIGRVFPLPVTSSGIVGTNGEHWRQRRRFTVTTLRNFGMGKRSMEQRVQEEAENLIKAIEATRGVYVFFTQKMIYVAFERIMKHLPGGHQKIFQECEVMKSFIKEQVQAHRKTLNPDSPRDFIDCFLIRANEEDEINSEECNEDSVVTLAFELFTAGTETISNTLLFSLLAVIQYPHIQEKVQKEINTVVGPNRLPTCSDRTQMPYTNAVVHEIMRYVDIVPLALPHKASEDTSFRGFMIPKGTTIFPLLGSVLSDPECWKTPYDFNPENFLDQNGLFCTQDAWMPFSAGKRICPGEALARMETFLFFTALLQKFTFKAANPSETFDLWTLRRAFRKKGLSYHLRAYSRT
ncbi:cytochrome P450 2B19-like [Eleutherodactylus coqui]|uniref:cytochrome P450 2B19-like n=1 Tax=Eleutherodactylus coqui TaxID=57060 RepID=UPI0034627655